MKYFITMIILKHKCDINILKNIIFDKIEKIFCFYYHKFSLQTFKYKFSL